MRYEIDADMVGNPTIDVTEFARILQGLVGDELEIVAVTDAANGANNSPSRYESDEDAIDAAILTDRCWNDALERASQ